MPDYKAHLKFDNKSHIRGRSGYQSCEGWIDVVAHGPAGRPTFGTPSGWGAREDESGEYNFAIDGKDPTTALIAQACTASNLLGTALLDVEAANNLVRLTMTEVLVSKCQAGQEFEFTLSYSKAEAAKIATPTGKAS